MSFARYYHTLRHLKPIQLYGRFAQEFYHPQADRSPAPPLREPVGCWTEAARRPARMLGPRTFRFLNDERELSWPGGWREPSRDRLWLYNLHYFEDLLAADASQRRAWHAQLIAQWLADNPPFEGPGWEPFPLSLRIANWIKWELAGGELTEAARHSLAVQARSLRERLELHLLGNHLLANAKALVFAGLYFSGDEAQAWLTRGLAILARQLHEQILPDGGHFELSPMYHSLVLEDLLDLINLSRAYAGALPPPLAGSPLAWQSAAQRMAQWLAVMTFPDGEIALVNDAAWKIAPAPVDLAAYAARLGVPRAVPPGPGIAQLVDSGYIRLERGPAVLILDVGEIGPRYLPGHGHADVLSFELALDGGRLVVDTGTSVYYGNRSERQRQRSTAAHNTVTVDDENSSEVWGDFRVARRAHPTVVSIDESPHELSVTASHDGFTRLPSHGVHERRWRLRNDGLTWEDRITGATRSAVARLHLAPGVRVEPTAGISDMTITTEIGHTVRYTVEGAETAVERTTFHPEFGVTMENQCLVGRMTASQATQRLVW